MNCVLTGLSAVSCAETVKQIEMQFRTLRQVGPGNMYYMACRCSPYGKGHFWGVWPIEKYCKA